MNCPTTVYLGLLYNYYDYSEFYEKDREKLQKVIKS
jgi:hypothetical protein